MRYTAILRLFSLTLPLSTACIGTDYPDEFDDMSQLTQAADAGADASSGAIFAPTGGGGVNPGQGAAGGGVGPVGTGSTQPPFGGGGFDAGTGGVVPPAGGSTGTPAQGVDAGNPFGGTRDSGTSVLPPVVDSGSPGTRVDAGVEPQVDATAPSDPGTGGGGAATSCKITASTDASDTFFYAGKYGCAVWISDSAKKLTKAFFVATRISSRSGLPTYRTQSSGVSVDVTTGATLNAPKQHSYTWDLSGVSPGQYSLNVEVHSSNGTTLVSVPFDTSKAPVSEQGAQGEVKSAQITCQ